MKTSKHNRAHYLSDPVAGRHIPEIHRNKLNIHNIYIYIYCFFFLYNKIVTDLNLYTKTKHSAFSYS